MNYKTKGKTTWRLAMVAAALCIGLAGQQFAAAAEPIKSVTSRLMVTETRGQQQARLKAKSYLSFMPFSYSGLVDQLKFDGFSTSDANYGVKAQKANWNLQAVKKAKSYLKIMSFSRQGLIDQLVFDGFTLSQATYGVRGAGY